MQNTPQTTTAGCPVVVSKTPAWPPVEVNPGGNSLWPRSKRALLAQIRFCFSKRKACRHANNRRHPMWAWGRYVIPLLTLAALGWFLIRVIPKPIRATYPCQRAAFPLVSAFVLWLIGLKGSCLAWCWRGERLKRYRPYLISTALLLLSGLVVWSVTQAVRSSTAASWIPSDPPNTPMGTGKGIYPGRVTWLRDPAATPWNLSAGHWWDDTTGINQAAVQRMMSRSLRMLAGTGTDNGAWDKIFRSFNNTHGRGDVGYRTNESIAIKINCNNSYGGHGDVDADIDASPQCVLAMLRQLVNSAGVPPERILVYEAVRIIPDRIYTRCHVEFPGVVWIDSTGTGSNLRQPVSWYSALTYSRSNPNCSTAIPLAVFQSTYIVNLALLKGHRQAGITLTAKNHYGSIAARDHELWVNASAHPMGIYNPLVDLMGTRHLGGKTVLFMIDGLFGVPDLDRQVDNTCRWNNLFSGGWSASILMSLDPVAVDSVGLDFLRSEFGAGLSGGNSLNADNYLHEAAQADHPPSGTVYRPDGVTLTSLGTHEHWNNAIDKQYSRNLGRNVGIELIPAHSVSGITLAVTNPINGASFAPGWAVPIQAQATALCSIIRKVDFFKAGQFLGTSSNAPFAVVWTNASVGDWALMAVATDSDNYAATSAVVNITVRLVEQPPAITLQPASHLVNLGSTAVFTVRATGSQPLRYQWQFNSAPLSGATNDILTLANVQDAQAGFYSVQVANEVTVLSSNAQLTINHLPVPGSPLLERFALSGVKVRIPKLLGSDPDQDPLTLLGIGQGSLHGATIRTNPAWLFYIPPAAFTNPDSFSYLVNDGRGGESPGTATVAVQAKPNSSQNYAVEYPGGKVVRLRFTGVPGRPYTLQYSDDAVHWQVLGACTTDSAGIGIMLDTVDNPASRSYRAVYP